MRPVGTYKSLDVTQPLTLSFTVAAVAAQIDQLNYGAHRMLSELILLRRERFRVSGHAVDKAMADALEDILERGLY